MWLKSLAAAVVVLVALRYAQYDDVILPLTKELNASYDYVIGRFEHRQSLCIVYGLSETDRNRQVPVHPGLFCLS